MLQNPEMIQMALNSPQMRQMAQNNPMMQQMLNNPQLLQQMLNPQTLQMMSNLFQSLGNEIIIKILHKFLLWTYFKKGWLLWNMDKDLAKI